MPQYNVIGSGCIHDAPMPKFHSVLPPQPVFETEVLKKGQFSDLKVDFCYPLRLRFQTLTSRCSRLMPHLNCCHVDSGVDVSMEKFGFPWQPPICSIRPPCVSVSFWLVCPSLLPLAGLASRWTCNLWAINFVLQDPLFFPRVRYVIEQGNAAVSCSPSCVLSDRVQHSPALKVMLNPPSPGLVILYEVKILHTLEYN